VRLILIGFALGIAWLQQQAVLPGAFVLCALALLVACACLLAWLSTRDSALLSAIVLRRVRVASLFVAAFSVGFAYGAWRAQTRLQLALPAAFESRNIALTGFVRGLPSQGEQGTRFLFEVESNEAGLKNFPRVVQLSWLAIHAAKRDRAVAPPPSLWAGQRWTLVVRLKRPHGNANFRGRDAEAAMLARNVRATGYVSVPESARRLEGDAHGLALTIDRWRARLRGRVMSALVGEPHRGVIVALAVGAQDAVSDEDWTLLRATGTSHLVAISGLHIGFVAGLAALVSGWFWRKARWRGVPAPLIVSSQKAAAAGAAGFAAFYAALAGFNVPAQRALWMLSFVALAVLSGRRPASSLVLAWALALVLLVDPWAVTAAGFWLSFCAVAAILFAIASRGRWASTAIGEDFVMPAPDESAIDSAFEATGLADEIRPRRNVFDRLGATLALGAMRLRWRTRHAMRRLGRQIASSARIQYAITLALAPLTAYWFFQVPLIGPFANAFAIPWISFLVTPAVLLAVLLPAPLDVFAYRAAHALLVPLFDALAHLSGPAWTLWRLPQPDGFALCAALGGVMWALAPRGWPLRFAAPLTWLPLAFPPAHAPSSGTFRVTALDIGQGSSIVIETARHTLLFDAGPGPESTHAGERIVVPYLFAHGLTTLDTLMISHADSDHSGGAPAVLDSIHVRQFLASLKPKEPLWASARAQHSDALRCVAGQRWQWDGVAFDVLWPDPGPLAAKPNATSCVLKVTAASGRSALFAADIEADVERQLLQRDAAALRADVLLVPHHGSKTSSTEPFLDAVQPRVAVFQVGYLNRFHHPHPTVFERYRMRHIELSRSDEDGAARMELSFDVSIERFRQTHARYWMGR